ncbi:MAG: hypothetical protein AB8H03_27440 [Saprospiraceae bacterium]
MKFDKEKYKIEMLEMVEQAIFKMKNEKPEFIIFTASIWTDANAAESSIGFESKSNSDKEVESSNKWNKKHYDRLICEGNLERAKLFEPNGKRNNNPADFELRDYVEIQNISFEKDWESKSNNKCWSILEPALKEIGQIAFNKIKELNIHEEFECSVNGRNDWYKFV